MNKTFFKIVFPQHIPWFTVKLFILYSLFGRWSLSVFQTHWFSSTSLPKFSPIKQFFGAVQHCMCMNIYYYLYCCYTWWQKRISLLACVNEEMFSVRGSVKSLTNKWTHHSAFTTALNWAHASLILMSTGSLHNHEGHWQSLHVYHVVL